MMMKQTKLLFWFIRIRLPPMITNDSSNSAPSRTDTMNFACHYLFDWYLRYSNHSSVKSMKNLPNGQIDILFTRTALPGALRVWTELAP
jgi:hypothetical protein